MTEMSNALRFMGLFKGYSQAYGTYNPSGLGGEGKQKPKYLAKKSPATVQNFDEQVLELARIMKSSSCLNTTV